MGDLSRFIEDAVRSYMLELGDIIDEAVQWVRKH